MPGRGRTPKPVAIHRLEGTYKSSRHDHRAREPQADGERATYPALAWKSDKRLTNVPTGPLRRADRQLFTNYVVLTDRFERAAIAQNALDAGSSAPMLMHGTPAVVVSPYVRIMNQATLPMNTLQAELEFTPSARARLGLPDLPGGEPASRHEMFDTILPDGKVIPCGRR